MNAGQVEKVQDGSPGLYRVTGLMNDGSEVVDEYNTVTSRGQLSCKYDSFLPLRDVHGPKNAGPA